jgi:hypothetical protein
MTFPTMRMTHAITQTLVLTKKVKRYGNILSASLIKRLNKKVRLGEDKTAHIFCS